MSPAKKTSCDIRVIRRLHAVRNDLESLGFALAPIAVAASPHAVARVDIVPLDPFTADVVVCYGPTVDGASPAMERVRRGGGRRVSHISSARSSFSFLARSSCLARASLPRGRSRHALSFQESCHINFDPRMGAAEDGFSRLREHCADGEAVIKATSRPRRPGARLTSEPGAALVDVRTAAEWNYVGLPDLSHDRQAAAARRVAELSLRRGQSGIRRDARRGVEEAGRVADAPVFFICRSGARSASAAAAMTAAGYSRCYNVAGGFEGAARRGGTSEERSKAGRRRSCRGSSREVSVGVCVSKNRTNAFEFGGIGMSAGAASERETPRRETKGRETTGGREAAAIWDRVRRRLRAELGEDVFSSWFARVDLEGLSAGVVRLSVPTVFLKGWIKSHYGDRLLGALARGGRERPPHRRAAPDGAPDRRRRSRSPRTSPESRRRRRRRDAAGDRFAGSPLDPRLTFATFCEGRSNDVACRAARAVAGAPEGSAPAYNPLYIHAGVGLGKTHLLQAIAHRGARARSEPPRPLPDGRALHGAVRRRAARPLRARLQGAAAVDRHPADRRHAVPDRQSGAAGVLPHAEPAARQRQAGGGGRRPSAGRAGRRRRARALAHEGRRRRRHGRARPRHAAAHPGEPAARRRASAIRASSSPTRCSTMWRRPSPTTAAISTAR